jgi:hypothetical protein
MIELVYEKNQVSKLPDAYILDLLGQVQAA